MSQPPAYNRQADFSEDTANNAGGRSTVNATKLDAELDAVETTLDALLTNLAILQRDDTKLRDGTVELHTLSAQVKALMAARGSVIRGDWVTGTVYAINDVVTESGATYICAVAHTSGVFATDLAASKWVMLMFAPSALAASGVSVTPAGNIAASDVQAALEELDTEKLSVASDLADLNDAPTALANLGALPLAGGTMTGKITLDGVPTSDLHAASKGYADDVINGMLAGQCHLAFSSATALLLSPFNGNRIFINGEWLTIPNSGVSLSNSGLSADTTYNVYALNSGESVALEASTTARATDTTYGHQVKSGDATRTLVGKVRTTAAGQFDATNPLNTISWFNRRLRNAVATSTASRATSSAPWVELHSELRLPFLTWGQEVVACSVRGSVTNSTLGAICYQGIGVDSSTVASAQSFQNTAVASHSAEMTTLHDSIISEGHHTVRALAGVGSGTGTWASGHAQTRVSIIG